MLCFLTYFFFFKQKTAYEMRISDWSSDVCSSDLARARSLDLFGRDGRLRPEPAVIDEDAAEGPATGRGGGGQRRFGSERSVRARWRQCQGRDRKSVV